ncbi:hypothetical protein HYH03_014050 [Edaphochlamys debaryana]|uniref:Ankyrin repeat domain-containing protein n=1 Tax=Edaphochlamys debaryana TaxID=47281 RepID=A0A835XPI4_9CHLO|nr:hypothetical protein HYH03_014050 [Edaphochlamys debaryana]|eukprot:KAG2487334.1 hypothetical protein HYH03_014050 [Edaphochlamys debaryana]
MSEAPAAAPGDTACDSQHAGIEPPPSAAWPPYITRLIGSYLTARESALLRLVDKTAAAAISPCTYHLSQRVPWGVFAAHWSAPAACRYLTYDQRLKLLTLVAASGDVANLDTAIESVGIDVGSSLALEIMRAAAEAAEFSAWQELAERELFSAHQGWGHVLTGAAKTGCQGLRDAALEHAQPTAEAACTAAEHGHVDLAAWFRDKAPWRYEDGLELVKAAARGCSLEGFQQLCLEEMPPTETLGAECERELLAPVAASPMPDWRERADWMVRTYGCEPCTEAYARAAELLPGSRAVERFAALRELGYPLDKGLKADFAEEAFPYDDEDLENVFGGILRSGNVDALRWLAAETQQVALATTKNRWSKRWDRDVEQAAKDGKLDVLKALADAGWTRWNGARLAMAAVEGGALRVLTWLVDTSRAGGRLTWGHSVAAARSGTPELLSYLRAHGCPWSREEHVELYGSSGSGGAYDTDDSDDEDEDGGEYEEDFEGESTGDEACEAGEGFAGDREDWGEDEEGHEEDAGGNSTDEEGHDEVVESSAEDGSEDDREAWGEAARSGCEAALERLSELGCPMPTNGRPYAEASGQGDLRTMGVLRRLQVPLGAPELLLSEAIHSSQTFPNLAAFELLADWCGPTVNWGAARQAAAKWRAGSDRSDVFRWIDANMPPRARQGVQMVWK